MSIAQKLENLTRLIPGVAGYQDKENSRNTDKTIRLRLTEELLKLKGYLEEEKRFYTERKKLSVLPHLDQIASKLDQLGNLIKYAARGYRSFFDTYKYDLKKIQRLYEFDIGLFNHIAILQNGIKKVQKLRKDIVKLKNESYKFNLELDRFKDTFNERKEILIQ
ncbi:MAG TPA: hypothetical protein VGB26_05370 [Nitrospiria bacterium]|jgi:hypothetical protein